MKQINYEELSEEDIMALKPIEIERLTEKDKIKLIRRLKKRLTEANNIIGSYDYRIKETELKYNKAILIESKFEDEVKKSVALLTQEMNKKYLDFVEKLTNLVEKSR